MQKFLGQNLLEEIIRQRRIEFAFEGHRFFDVRRWKLGDTYLNKPVTGMRIINTAGVLTFTPFEVEKRVFADKNYLYPFSQNDINRQPALIQNPGY